MAKQRALEIQEVCHEGQEECGVKFKFMVALYHFPNATFSPIFTCVPFQHKAHLMTLPTRVGIQFSHCS